MKIIDPKALSTPRSPLCEYCSLYCRRPTERHHIIARGMGGGSRLDVLENLIDLGGAWDCDCHGRAQAGEIDRDQLFRIIAVRLRRKWWAIRNKVVRLSLAQKRSVQDPLKGSGQVKRKLP